MDHRYIEEHNIVDRYLMDRLSPEARLQFEAHYFKCDECFEQVEVTDDFRRSLQRVAARQSWPSSGPNRVGLVGWLMRLAPRWQVALLVGGLLLVMALPMTLLVNRIERLQRDLDRVKTPSSEPSRPMENGQPPASAWEKKLQELEREWNQQRQRLEAQLQQEQQARNRMADELSRLTRPQGNTPIFNLSAIRGGRPTEAGLVNPIDLSESPPWIVFSLDLEVELEYESYRATVLTAGNRFVWRNSRLRPNQYNALTASFSSDYFQAGDYLLVLEGVTKEGQLVLVANYPFRVIKRK
jgi:hypothetical protein